MPVKQTRSLQGVVKAVDRYPEEAYHFVREGLDYAVEQVHGPPSPELQRVREYLAAHQIDLPDLFEQLDEGRVDPPLRAAIEAAGGYEKLNRHVSGQEFCWAIRDLALDRWGPLATSVLRSWNITTTLDFGRIVFALIQHDFMQKQPHDRLEDFGGVYDFEEALTGSFRIGEQSPEPSSPL